MTLFAKYAALKKRVGGNREIMGYEETFGQPREEAMHITPPTDFQEKILAELEFAIRLSAEKDHVFDDLIDRALEYLKSEMDRDGVLTRSAAERTEEILLPMEEAAKEYSLILVGHAHIDMNWMWSWHETVAATLATFRTMLKIMDEYPDFCFSQSQTAVYKIVEDFEPDMMKQIKKRIAEGRWEITSSAWVETDKNMPSTESLISHIRCTKRYLKDVWGVDPDSLDIDFSPDTFGHSANMPEIDLQGGVKYYYHCRGLDGDNALYRWKGQSGKELLCYREQHWYNSGITPKIGLTAIDISERSGGLKTGLIVYGVGDHGGGPTRRDVERAIRMQSWRIFPAIRFGTMREYFKIAESVRDRLPVVDHELNLLFTGCYTTQSRVKLGNRQCENALADARSLSSYAAFAAKAPYHGKELEIANRDVLFTHFHDILTGSCVQDSREHAMGLYSNALARFQNESLNAMMAISDQIDTSAIHTERDCFSQAPGAGAGYGVADFNGKPVPESGSGLVRIFTVFNPTGVSKKECVELTVWDWTGDLRRLTLKDADGNPIELQLLTHRPESYWDHKFIRLLAYTEVPALGYTTLVLGESEIGDSYPFYLQPESRTQKPYRDFVLDNGLIRAVFDFRNGDLKSLTDLQSGKENIRSGETGSFVLIDTESRTSNAWNIGRYLKIHKIDDLTEINGGHAHGSLRNGLHFTAKVLNSTVTADITLDKGSTALSIKIRVDWNETAGETVPVLAYAVPLAYASDAALYDIPAGVITRPTGAQDAPGLSFCSLPDGNGKAVAMIADCKYGYRALPDGTLISTLINTAGSPDKYPERGIHQIRLNVALLSDEPKAIKESADSLIRSLSYLPATSHTGHLPTSSRFFDYSCKTSVLSSLSCSEDGGALILRFVNLSDHPDSITLNFRDSLTSAVAVDYLERTVPHEITLNGTGLETTVGGCEILTLKIVCRHD
ncbi:MAG: glycoside hydrolase family 38 C-terminal domain-containing protein [Eubacteriales bacterium]